MVKKGLSLVLYEDGCDIDAYIAISWCPIWRLMRKEAGG